MRTVWRAVATLVISGVAAGAAHADVLSEIAARLQKHGKESAPRVRFEDGTATAGGRTISGLRARHHDATRDSVDILYPHDYAQPFVVARGSQRLAVQAIGASHSALRIADDRLSYENAYRAVDIVQAPGAGRSEEFLFLRDRTAPAVFDYAVAEMEGVSEVALVDGAIHFRALRPTASQVARGGFMALGGDLIIERPWVIDATGARSETAARWSILEGGRLLRLTIDADSLQYPVVVDPTFTSSSSITPGRERHTSTMLPTGKVLIAGGYANDQNLGMTPAASAYLYDPSTGTAAATDSLDLARYDHTATLLQNGKVLFCGGTSVEGATASAELFDPATGLFSATGALHVARRGHTATLLGNGKVLIAGGETGSNDSIADAELYDPSTGQFAVISAMNQVRRGHAAALLPGGKVLIAGGREGSTTALVSAELFNPVSNTFSFTAGEMVEGRYDHSLTPLANGKVLAVAGSSGSTTILSSAELFDPVSETFATTTGRAGRTHGHSATLLPNGKVVIAGGQTPDATSNAALLYDPDQQTFGTLPVMTARRTRHTATLLPGGAVLLTGGRNGINVSGSMELFVWTAESTAATDSMDVGRAGHTATLLPNGKVLIAGSRANTATAELYDPATGLFASNGSMITGRGGHTATLLPNGKVLLAGGATAGTSAELYDPATNTFAATGAMTVARSRHRATLLPNGKVLLTGGEGAGATAELYDPAIGRFSATAAMTSTRFDHSATLVQNGTVLLCGGSTGGNNTTFTCELFNPSTGAFAATGSLPGSLYLHTATLLSNNRVLILGGSGGTSTFGAAWIYDATTGATSSLMNFESGHERERRAATVLNDDRILLTGGGTAEFSPVNGWTTITREQVRVFDPARQSSSDVASLLAGRYDHTATLLPSGKVLIAGSQGEAMLVSAELYDPGLGYPATQRPVISAMTERVCQPGTIVVTGSGFSGASEGSSGTAQSSSSGAPLLRLQRLDNDQIVWVRPDAWSASSFLSTTVTGLPFGHYRATIIRNGIPSVERLIEVSSMTSPSLGNYSNASAITGTSLSVAPASPLTYVGTTTVSLTVGSGFSGTAVLTANGAVTFSNVGPVGSYGVTVSVSTSCGGLVQRSFTLTVADLQAPANVTAAASTTSQVSVSWTAAAGASSYEVFRSSGAGPFNSVGTTSGTSFSDGGLVAGATYVYKVKSSGSGQTSGFSLPDLATTTFFTNDPVGVGITAIKAVHITEVRSAVNAVRVAAGLGAATYTNGISPGAVVRAADIQELRSALAAARSVIGVPAVAWTNSVTSGVVVRGADITEIRNGVK